MISTAKLHNSRKFNEETLQTTFSHFHKIKYKLSVYISMATVTVWILRINIFTQSVANFFLFSPRRQLFWKHVNSAKFSVQHFSQLFLYLFSSFPWRCVNQKAAGVVGGISAAFWEKDLNPLPYSIAPDQSELSTSLIKNYTVHFSAVYSQDKHQQTVKHLIRQYTKIGRLIWCNTVYTWLKT